MAAKVNVCNVVVMDNPSSFSNPFQFEITFECFENLEEDLEWKLTYVGSAESDKHDQMLDSVLVGPIPEGRHMFVFQADPPNPKKIPPSEALGVTVILLSCAYRNQEFIKIGYFVQNEYDEEEMKENPPDIPQFHMLKRKIVADEPRVTRFQIKWSDAESAGIPENPESENSADGDVDIAEDRENFESSPQKSQENPASGSLQQMREVAKELNSAKSAENLVISDGASGVTNGDVDME